MVVEIKNSDTADEVKKKLDEFNTKIAKKQHADLSKYFGTLKLDKDPVALQHKWRDEW